MNRNDRAIATFTMLGHGAFHTCELVIPLFVAVWLDVFPVSPATLGVVVGASYALTGLGALPSGIVADRYGSRWLVLGSMIGMAAGFLLVGLAPTFPVLVVGLLVWGGAASLYHPAGLALISRGTTERGTAFAYHGVAGNLGVATGPLLGTLLLVVFDWRVVAGLLVIPVVLGVAVGVRLNFESPIGSANQTDTGTGHEPDLDVTTVMNSSKQLFGGAFAVVFLIGTLYGLYYRGAFTFLPEILAGLETVEPIRIADRQIPAHQSVYSGLLLLGGIGQYVGGKLVDRVRAETALVGTFACLALLALAFVPAANLGGGPLIVIAGLLGFTVFMEAPINQEVLSKHVPVALRGLSFGYTYTAVFGVGALGAAVAGVILTEASSTVLFGLEATIAIVAGALGIVLLQRS